MSSITTHVLDTTHGGPAAGISVALERVDSEGDSEVISQAVTDADGRVNDWPDAGPLEVGEHRLRFGTAAYFTSLGVDCFFPWVTVHFRVEDAGQRYHVPLLLSRFGYTIYRGS